MLMIKQSDNVTITDNFQVALWWRGVRFNVIEHCCFTMGRKQLSGADKPCPALVPDVNLIM